MQDTIYCFRFLARRQKHTLLHILCALPAVTVIWMLNPEWPFWTAYLAGAVLCTAVLVRQYAAPLPIRCPHCGYARLRPAAQTPEEQRKPDTGIMLKCRNCSAVFYTDAYIPWPGKSIRRRMGSPDEWDGKTARKQNGPAVPEKGRRPDRFS